MRSLGVVSRQSPSNAARAAFMASSTCPGPDGGAVAYVSPVEGLTTTSVAPSREAVNVPLMKLCSSRSCGRVDIRDHLARHQWQAPGAGGTSSAGLRSKKPNGFSQNDTV